MSKKIKEDKIEIDPTKVDQSKVLDTVLKEIPQTFVRDILVKPLPVEKVTLKQIVVDEKSKKDKDGNYTGTKEEVKEVDSMYGKGIILKVSDDYITACDTQKIPEDKRRKPGDFVYYVRGTARPFDLYRDSVLISPYNIVAYELPKV